MTANLRYFYTNYKYLNMYNLNIYNYTVPEHVLILAFRYESIRQFFKINLKLFCGNFV